MQSSKIYICYSHQDEKWLDRLLSHLRPLEQSGTLELWEDRLIKPGEEWYTEIETAINRANIAILLISEGFLASRFLQDVEVPRLLSRREKEGLQIIPIIIKPCAWTNVHWLSRLQVRPRNAKPLSQKNKAQIDNDLATVAKEMTLLTSQIDTLNIPKNLDRKMPNNTEKDDSNTKRNVFVVHGRNDTLRRSMFDFLRTIGLNPIEWTKAIGMTGKGSPFIGDVLDIAMEQTQAIVVLFTGDDEAKLKDEFISEHDPDYEKQLTPQARPNVLFEAGMAFGKYPERVILVQVGSMRPFSDIAGRHIVHLTDSLKSRQDLALRLENAGCTVDLKGTDWHSTGKFSIRSGKKETVKKLELKSKNISQTSLIEEVSKKSNLPVGALDILLALTSTPKGLSGDILFDVLTKVTGSNPLHIRKNCELIIEKGFVNKSSSGFSEIYVITKKGEAFLLETGLV